jgi:hypothetical protein
MRASMRTQVSLAIALVTTAVTAPACLHCSGLGAGDASVPACADAACADGGVQGRCETGGYCSYPADPADCFTGRRWGGAAPPGETPGSCVTGEPADTCGCADDANECTRETCAAGRCEHPADYDGNSCTGGTCVDGACCMGCWNGAGCRPGTEQTACGGNGTMCALCPLDTACMVYTCAGYCLGEIVDAPGCPPCGGLDEPCCQGMVCDAPLSCQVGGCGKDCFESRCLP